MLIIGMGILSFSCDTLALRNIILEANAITASLNTLPTGFDDFSSTGSVEQLNSQINVLLQAIHGLEKTMVSQNFSEDMEAVKNFYNHEYRQSIVNIKLAISEKLGALKSMEQGSDTIRQNSLINELKESINAYIDIHNQFIALLESQRGD